ncbi:MAG: hypothetical protein J7L11_03110 [Thermoprotei archaeon]|nr:hypothetical protein [Thermoprotei archaeon]
MHQLTYGFRKVRGPYGRSRQYILSLPRAYVEEVLRLGYSGFLAIPIRTLMLLVPCKGYDAELIADRVRRNFPFLEELEEALMGKEPLLMKLESAVRRLEKSLKLLENSSLPTYSNKLRSSPELPSSSSSLPSYLRDNPWLDILSKRGIDQ